MKKKKAGVQVRDVTGNGTGDKSKIFGKCYTDLSRTMAHPHIGVDYGLRPHGSSLPRVKGSGRDGEEEKGKG